MGGYTALDGKGLWLLVSSGEDILAGKRVLVAARVGFLEDAGFTSREMWKESHNAAIIRASICRRGPATDKEVAGHTCRGRGCGVGRDAFVPWLQQQVRHHVDACFLACGTIIRLGGFAFTAVLG